MIEPDFIQHKRPFVQPPVGTAFDPKTKTMIDVVDFPYDLIDGQHDRVDALSLAAEELHRLCLWLWNDQRPRRRFRAATTKLVAMTATLSPGLLANITARELRTEGCTTARLADARAQFRQQFRNLQSRMTATRTPSTQRRD